MKEVIYFDSAILIGGHALILGHKPSKLTMDQIHKKIEDEPVFGFTQLGLFDSSSPNYTTYYPEVTKEDLIPSDDEFIEPIFRILSAVTVHKKWNPIFFSEQVLKKSMYKLIGLTINVDHEMAVGNAIGSIKSVEWQKAYSINGIKVPAGINGVYKIDGKANPRLSRGIMMDPPSIHSNSVTVNFTWKKSHSKMDDNEFYNKLGTYGKDGKLVQRIATDVAAYHETSLVSHGADPFSQRIKDGKIVNPEYAGSQYWTTDTANKVKEVHNACFLYDWKDCESFKENTILTTGTTIPDAYNNNNDKQIENMKELLTFLETTFSLKAESLTEENYQEELDKIGFADLKAKAEAEPEPIVICELEGVEAIETEITTLREFKEKVPANLEGQIALATTGQVAIDELKAETKRLYKLVAGEGKEDAAILAIIEGADYKTLQSLHKQYDKATDGEFNFECADCHSHNITRMSANPGTEDEGHVVKTNQEIIGKFTGANNINLPGFMKEKQDK